MINEANDIVRNLFIDNILMLTGYQPSDVTVTKQEIKSKVLGEFEAYHVTGKTNDGNNIGCYFIMSDVINSITVEKKIADTQKTIMMIAKSLPVKDPLYQVNQLDFTPPTRREDPRDFIDDEYKRMGMIDDFREEFPCLKKYEMLVLKAIHNINADDFIYLCKMLEKMVKYLDDEKASNFRLCRSSDGNMTENYILRRASGCCRAFDHHLVNKKTGNGFFIGADYDHLDGSRYL